MTLLNDNETGRIYKFKHLITIFSVHWMEASFLHIETARIDYSWMSWGGGKGKDDWTLLSGLSSWVTSIIVIMQWWQFTNVCEINSYKQTSIQTRYDHMQYFFSWTRQTWGGKISDMWYLEFVRVNLVLSFIFLCVFRVKKNICEFSFSYLQHKTWELNFVSVFLRQEKNWKQNKMWNRMSSLVIKWNWNEKWENAAIHSASERHKTNNK